MKDIHSHILFSIDDGSKSIEESINIIKQASSFGYTDIVLTPHYRKIQNYTCNNEEKQKLFDELNKELKKQNIDVNIYLGNEVTIDDDLFKNIKDKKVTTINKGRYLLLELPFNSRISGINDIIIELNSKGIIPIIAHPERYRYYHNNYDKLQRMIDSGALFQGNLYSLYNKRSKSKKMLEGMLKRHMIHFIGTDIHSDKQKVYKKEKRIIRKLTRLTKDRDMAIELIDTNIDKVINNKYIEPYEVKSKKGSIFK